MPTRHAWLRSLAGTWLLAALMLAPLPSQSAPKPAKGGKPAGAPGAEEKSDKDKPFQDWKKITKDAEKKDGFFALWKKRETLYLEIKPDQMNKDFLGIYSYARGIGSNFILGGLPLGNSLLAFERVGDHVLMLEKNTRFAAPAGSAYEKARDLSEGHSVLASLKIESENDSTKAVLVDFTPVVVSDYTDLAENMKFAFGGKSVRFDKDRSALGAIKTFPENDEIEALLTYSPNDRTGLDLPSVPDERYIPITVHYSFSKLPETPMVPRYADDRVGYFLTASKDFSRDNAENFFLRYVNHWRLEKKDPSAAVSEPVKPIVYYVDRTIPEAYRPYIKQGIERWQKAFEAAGFKNAIIAKDPPDDPNWDPEDVRYSTIRWITSNEPSFGAIGPSRVDPRTGEILDADILIEGSQVQGYRNQYRRYAGPDAIAGRTLPALQAWPPSMPMELRCDAGQSLLDDANLLHVGLLVDGSLPPGSPVPEEFVGQALVELTMHEVGHTLGLRHNFRSSTSTPFDKLNDKDWTNLHGMTSSVMDYAPVNISPDRSKQGLYYALEVGDCDVWSIRYGYTPSGVTIPEGDYAVTRKIADESNMPGHEYSTDEDTYPSDALDPRTNIFDLGDDPLRYAKERSAYISGLWKSGKLEDRILGSEGEYPVLRRAMDALIAQYGTCLGLAVKYVGGQYVSRNHKGQPGAKDPLQLVPAARQREALDFLAQRAFSADAFTVSPALLNRLAPDRWAHWGMASGFNQPSFRLDYGLNDRTMAIQTVLLNALTSPALLARLRESESRSADAFRLADHFDRMTRMLWGEVAGTSPAAFKALEGPSTRREVQRAYIDRLAGMVVSPAPGAPDDARALARLQLSRIDSRCAQALAAKVPMGDYTRAHLIESRARIKRALEASREADSPAGRAGATASP